MRVDGPAPLQMSSSYVPHLRVLSLSFLLVLAASATAAEKPPEQETRGLTPMLESQIDRPLRYHPDGTDFVITNGSQFFNRPLYGGNTAFRVDAGDRPEFSFYLPGRGGNLRFGVGTVTDRRAGWLHEATNIIARYRPGSMVYDIQHPVFKGGTLELWAVPDHDSEGLLLRVELRGTTNPVVLIAAFGGVSGERGRRGGDIGCETVPVSEFFQLRTDQCRGNTPLVAGDHFALRGPAGVMTGVWSHNWEWETGDAMLWDNPRELVRMGSRNSTTQTPVVVGVSPLVPNVPQYLGIQRFAAASDTNDVLRRFREAAENKAGGLGGVLWRKEDLPQLIAVAYDQRKAIAERVVVDTPDPFINAAAAALNIAADAVWDEGQSSFMHGAVAWRVRLLGWRGPYSGDELGWHDRTARHLSGYAAQQNTNPVPDEIPSPEPSVNLSRNETALHSNGDMTRSHYDMNLVSVDAFFRHLLWTGDLEYARRMWPVIERHLAWERRLFRREFGSKNLPLYEAYCCIWASDDLAYNGGGAAHSSAYNFYHNQLAARVARLLGKDPAPYEREAELVARGMREQLWLQDRGWFAEWKDSLGLQLTHPNAAVWTFYHTIDSEVPTPFEAWQMSRFVDSMIPRLPLRGANVPEGNYNIATSSWMPYTWSLNNVVLAESAHTALAYWQAKRPEAAMPLFKGALLDSMYCGLCPGNVGMCTYFDAYRRESQRDFADGVGSLSRALVEGLFGVQPNALAGELTVRPGFPSKWDKAGIKHPDFTFAFRRESLREKYVVESRFAKPMALTLEIPALRDRVQRVTVNGRTASWQVLDGAIGTPRIQVKASPGTNYVIVDWKGDPPAKPRVPTVAARDSQFVADCGADVVEVADPQRALNQIDFVNRTIGGKAIRALGPQTKSAQAKKHIVCGQVIGVYGPRTVFARVEQGSMRWWQPLAFDVRPAFEVVPSQTQDEAHLRFHIRNNTRTAMDCVVTTDEAGQTSTARLRAEAFQDSTEIALPAVGCVPGSNPVVVNAGTAGAFGNNIVNWNIRAGTAMRLETVPMADAFNDRVGQIFRNEYLAPRSAYCSLAVPKQGIGSWTHPADTFNVDDSGLRGVSAANGGKFVVRGIPFATPATMEDRNILFTSQWTNYPSTASVPLNGKASHVYLLMAGSSNPMQSRIDNGEVEVAYTDGSSARLALENPVNWWPIDQDYFIDDFAFRRTEPIPPRVDLKTGLVWVYDATGFKGKGRTVPGGAATVLDLPLDSMKELKSITVKAVANEVVIGLMAATLVR